jgi:hypothetical protein
MDNSEHTGCTPDKCDSCTGCGGSIEKISLRVEWKHKGTPADEVAVLEESIHSLSRDLTVSGVELIYINNTFSPDIAEGSSAFFINSHALETLTPLPEDGKVTREVLRKGIFQALLQNV